MTVLSCPLAVGGPDLDLLVQTVADHADDCGYREGRTAEFCDERIDGVGEIEARVYERAIEIEDDERGINHSASAAANVRAGVASKILVCIRSQDIIVPEEEEGT